MRKIAINLETEKRNASRSLPVRQLGIKFGFKFEINSPESVLTLSNCQFAIASLKLFCNNKLPE